MSDRPTEPLENLKLPKSFDQVPGAYRDLIKERAAERQPEDAWKLAAYEAAREKVVIEEVKRIRQGHEDLRKTIGKPEEEQERAWEILQVLNDIREQMMRHDIYTWTDVPKDKFPPDRYIMSDYERMFLEHAVDLDAHLRDGKLRAFFRFARRMREKMLDMQKSFGGSENVDEVGFSKISGDMRTVWLSLQQKLPRRESDNECRPVAEKMADAGKIIKNLEEKFLKGEELSPEEQERFQAWQTRGSILTDEEIAKWESEPEHRRREGEPEYEYLARQDMETMRLTQPEEYLYHLEILGGEENFTRFWNISYKKEIKARGGVGEELEVSVEDEGWFKVQQHKLTYGNPGQPDDEELAMGESVSALLNGGKPVDFVKQMAEFDKQAGKTEEQEEFDESFWEIMREEYIRENPAPTDYTTAWQAAERHIAEAKALFSSRVKAKEDSEDRVGPRREFNKYQSVIMSSAVHYEMAWQQLDGAARLAQQKLNTLEEQLRELKSSPSPDAARVAQLEGLINEEYERAYTSYRKGIECLRESADILSYWTGGKYSDAWNHQTRIGRLAKESSLAQHDLRMQYARAREGTPVADEERFHAKQSKVYAYVHELASLDAQIARLCEQEDVRKFSHIIDLSDILDAKTQEQGMDFPIRAPYRRPETCREEYVRLRQYYHLRAERQAVISRLQQAIDELKSARPHAFRSADDDLNLENVLVYAKDGSEEEKLR